MVYVDKIITCFDCSRNFTFSASEQEFFVSKGFANEPRRCTDCRATRKQQRSGGYGGGYRQRRMYPAVCASCGKDCQVPFEPRDGRPVYCPECYALDKR